MGQRYVYPTAAGRAASCRAQLTAIGAITATVYESGGYVVVFFPSTVLRAHFNVWNQNQPAAAVRIEAVADGTPGAVVSDAVDAAIVAAVALAPIT